MRWNDERKRGPARTSADFVKNDTEKTTEK